MTVAFCDSLLVAPAPRRLARCARPMQLPCTAEHRSVGACALTRRSGGSSTGVRVRAALNSGARTSLRRAEMLSLVRRSLRLAARAPARQQQLLHITRSSLGARKPPSGGAPERLPTQEELIKARRDAAARRRTALGLTAAPSPPHPFPPVTRPAVTVGSLPDLPRPRQVLNAEQRAVVLAPTDVTIRVMAGPGSGKTRVLTTRVAHLARGPPFLFFLPASSPAPAAR